MKSRPKLEKKLAVVFILFFALLQFPLISIFNQAPEVGQWPLLFISILLVWIMLIATLYVVIEGNPFKSKSGE